MDRGITDTLEEELNVLKTRKETLEKNLSTNVEEGRQEERFINEFKEDIHSFLTKAVEVCDTSTRQVIEQLDITYELFAEIMDIIRSATIPVPRWLKREIRLAKQKRQNDFSLEPDSPRALIAQARLKSFNTAAEQRYQTQIRHKALWKQATAQLRFAEALLAELKTLRNTGETYRKRFEEFITLRNKIRENLFARPYNALQVTQEQVDEDAACSICLKNYQVDETISELPCKHTFDTECIKEWLNRSATCPVCRQNPYQ